MGIKGKLKTNLSGWWDVLNIFLLTYSKTGYVNSRGMTLIKVLLHHWIKAVFIGHLKIQSTSIMQIFIIEKICYNSNLVDEKV